MQPEAVKCPTCRREPGGACLKLVRTPDQRVVWTTSEAHPARMEKAGD